MSKKPKKISEIGELGLLKRLRAAYKVSESNLIADWNDDTAILPIQGSKNRFLLMTSDMLVEGVHFSSKTISMLDLGQRAIRVNLSDIAAMAGKPTFFTVSLGAPPDYPLENLEQLYKGMRKTAKKFDVKLCGGDVVKAPVLTLSISMLGEFNGPLSKIPMRNKMKVGDYIYLTGTIGDSAMGLKILSGECPVPESFSHRNFEYLRRCHVLPQPRILEAQALCKKIKRFSAIDLSDDLKISLDHLATTSGKGYQIDLDKLPLSNALLNFFEKDLFTAAKAALYGGEDFELLFTCTKKPDDVKTIFKKAGLETSVTNIGRVIKKESVINWQGKPQKLSSKSFEHF